MLKFILLISILCGISWAAPSPSSLHALSEANDNFGLRLLHNLELNQLAKKDWKTRSNVFISPFSIGTVMSMLMAGGQNQTYEQIYKTLGFQTTKLTKSDLFTTYKQTLDSLNSHFSDTPNILSIANAIAARKQLPIKQQFLHEITTNFESKVFAEDFAHNSVAATDEINQFISTKTHGKIAKLFDQALPSDTALVLLNAIYFKGSWKVKFNKEKTLPNFFFNPDDQSDQKPTVYLMSTKSEFNYAEFQDGQLLELLYQNDSLSMYIFLPPQGPSPAKPISSLLTTNTLKSRIAKLRRHPVQLELPKFKLEQKYELNGELEKLGIVDAFVDGKADLSNIDGARDLHVSKVVHKTQIEVNEEGAEASAATGVVVAPPMAQPVVEPAFFRADHPFLFVIRHKPSAITLFAGIVNNPGKSS